MSFVEILPILIFIVVVYLLDDRNRSKKFTRDDLRTPREESYKQRFERWISRQYWGDDEGN
ncbi:MAG: hypothetical protein IJ438_07455 [Clostridia bacterium]|nr:hypothetical protein [Clostridia bacterium]